MLYQLNYIHHVRDCKGTKKFGPCKRPGRKILFFLAGGGHFLEVNVSLRERNLYAVFV